jgi:hypothetical protein
VFYHAFARITERLDNADWSACKFHFANDARAWSLAPHVDCGQFCCIVVDGAMTAGLDGRERDIRTFQLFARAIGFAKRIGKCFSIDIMFWSCGECGG